MKSKHTLMSCLIVILTLCAAMLSIAAASETTPFEIAVEVSSSTAISKEPFVLEAGDTFEVSISIDSNPGICAIDLRFTYDTDALTLLTNNDGKIDYVKGEAVPADIQVKKVSENKIKIFLDLQSNDFTTNGKIVTLKFQVNEGFHGTTGFDIPLADFMNVKYDMYDAAKNLDAKVNVHAFTAEPDVKIANCTESGSITYTCATCSEKFVLPGDDALGHDFANEWTVDLAPTCTEDGSKSHHCTRCDEISDVTLVERLSHSFSEWTQTAAPNCTEKGGEKRTCSTCNIEETQEIAALGHDYAAEWTVDAEADCVTAGSKSKHCTRCADKSEITEIPAVGHTFGDWSVEKASTCTEAGNMKRICSACDASENEPIAPLGHTSANYEYVEATTESVGYAGGTYCTTCNVTLTERTTLPMIEINDDKDDDDNNMMYIIIAVIVGVVIGGGVCATVLIVKKKSI